MKNRFSGHTTFLFSLLLSFCLLLTVCGGAGATSGTSDDTSVKSVSPTATNVTQMVLQPTATIQSTDNRTSVGLGKDYAFIRNNQVWVALNGLSPVQATHIGGLEALPGDVLRWSNLFWFAQDRYIAFTLSTVGKGGNYCHGLPVSGQLFVLDTSTLQTMPVALPGVNTSSTAPIDGFWQILTPQDDTHLLMWNYQGIYQYDLTTKALTQIITKQALPSMADQFSFSMSYKNGQLYYEIATPHDISDTSHFVIYSQSLNGPKSAPTKVFDAGSETYCSMKHQSGLVGYPGWDISPDGTHLAVQTIEGTDTAQPQGKIEIVSLQGGETTPVFEQVPADILNRDLILRWSPNNQMIFLTSQQSNYTSSITNPSATQTYNPHYLNNLCWHTSGTEFAAENQASNSVNLYSVGNPDGQLLVSNASDFAWGNQ